MKISDAKKILSGAFTANKCKQSLAIRDKDDTMWDWIDFKQSEVQFMLRQLALKTEKEKGKDDKPTT